jgi:isocitrate lyase
VQAGLLAIYLSGWQVAADANGAGHMYPAPKLCTPWIAYRLWCAASTTPRLADQIHSSDGCSDVHYLQPIVADAEAGFVEI